MKRNGTIIILRRILVEFHQVGLQQRIIVEIFDVYNRLMEFITFLEFFCDRLNFWKLLYKHFFKYFHAITTSINLQFNGHAVFQITF